MYYFIFLKASNEQRLWDHNTTMLDDYVNSAPEEAFKYTEERYQKFHIVESGKGNSGSQYMREISSNDDLYFDRSVLDYANRVTRVIFKN